MEDKKGNAPLGKGAERRSVSSSFQIVHRFPSDVNGHVAVPIAFLTTPGISVEARGLFIHLASKPPGAMVKIHPEYLPLLDELEEAGWIVRGTFGGEVLIELLGERDGGDES